MKKKQRTLLITLLAAGLASHPCHAYARVAELFRCGSLGRVTLISQRNQAAAPLRNTHKAELTISSKRTVKTGVVHSFMSENDRTFTSSPNDNFRNPDQTSKDNPVTLHVVSGYVYGKEREQITIYTLDEAKTCIREN